MLINISICTCQRPRLLTIAIKSLLNMALPENAQVKISIIDNDPTKSAESVVSSFGETNPEIQYLTESRRGIPIARNAAVEFAISINADYLVFIDDDEWVENNWLIELFNFCQVKGGRSVISGKVIADLPIDSPGHLAQFYNRKTFISGKGLKHCATDNVMIPMFLFTELGMRFDESRPLEGGTDTLFFNSAATRGVSIFQCAESVVHENIPKSRISLKWMGKRKYRAGITLAALDISNGRNSKYSIFFLSTFKILYTGTLMILCAILNKKTMRNSLYLKSCRSFGKINGAIGNRVNSYKLIDNEQ